MKYIVCGARLLLNEQLPSIKNKNKKRQTTKTKNPCVFYLWPLIIKKQKPKNSKIQ